jgi:hypothetical protein
MFQEYFGCGFVWGRSESFALFVNCNTSEVICIVVQQFFKFFLVFDLDHFFGWAEVESVFGEIFSFLVADDNLCVQKGKVMNYDVAKAQSG